MARLSEPRLSGKTIPIRFPLDTANLSEEAKFLKRGGSRYPPFRIEPFPHERQRTIQRMSDEDRARRVSWLRDQKLAPTEPGTSLLPKIYPRNIFRRVYAFPLNIVERALGIVMKEQKAFLFRYLFSRSLMVYGLAVSYYYLLKYHGRKWDTAGCWVIYSMDLDVQNAGKVKHPSEYADHGFKARSAVNF